MYQSPVVQSSTLSALLGSPSIVPEWGVLRLLYQQAQNIDYEYASSVFWQVWLQTMFMEDDWIVVCEFPPDKSLRRCDIVVRKYDPDNHTLSSFVYIEVKKPDGDLRGVKKQALDAAQRAIETDRLTGVYVMATIGTRFISWYVDSDADQLRDLDFGHYVDADSPEARCLVTTVETIKSSPPLRIAPVLPSQPLPAPGVFNTEDQQQAMAQDTTSYQQAAGNTMTFGQQDDSMPEPMDHDQRAHGWQHYGQESGGQQDLVAGPSAHDAWASEPYIQEGVSVQQPMDYDQQAQGWQHYDQASHGQQDAVAGPSGTALPTATQESGNATVPVEYIKVTVEKKTLQNQYKFRDAGGRTRVTRKEEWVRTEYKGKPAWVYRGSRKTYYTRNKVE